MTEAVGLSLAILTLMFRGVSKVYESTPARELRRRAAKGDASAHDLYQAVRFESRLNFLIEIFIAGLLSGLVYVLIALFSKTAAIAIAGLLILYVYAVSPARRTNSLTQFLARKMAPSLAFMLHYLSPVLHLLHPRGFGRRKALKLYDADDLIEFLEHQKNIEGSRISNIDLDKSIASLTDHDNSVIEAMITRKEMKILKADDEVGPILLSELYDSGQDCFAVEETDDTGEIVGVVALEELVDQKTGGTVAKIMNKKLAYLHETWLISEAASAWLATKQNVFLIINTKQKIVGIVSISSLLEKLIGKSALKKSRKYFDIEKIAKG